MTPLRTRQASFQLENHSGWRYSSKKRGLLRAAAGQLYGPGDLGDRLDLLAELYHDSGNHDKAHAAELEATQLRRRHNGRLKPH